MLFHPVTTNAPPLKTAHCILLITGLSCTHKSKYPLANCYLATPLPYSPTSPPCCAKRLLRTTPSLPYTVRSPQISNILWRLIVSVCCSYRLKRTTKVPELGNTDHHMSLFSQMKNALTQTTFLPVWEFREENCVLFSLLLLACESLGLCSSLCCQDLMCFPQTLCPISPQVTFITCQAAFVKNSLFLLTFLVT